MEERVSRRILCRNEIEEDYKGEKGSEKGSFRGEKFFTRPILPNGPSL